MEPYLIIAWIVGFIIIGIIIFNQFRKRQDHNKELFLSLLSDRLNVTKEQIKFYYEKLTIEQKQLVDGEYNSKMDRSRMEYIETKFDNWLRDYRNEISENSKATSGQIHQYKSELKEKFEKYKKVGYELNADRAQREKAFKEQFKKK